MELPEERPEDWSEANRTVSEQYFGHRLIPQEPGSSPRGISSESSDLGSVRVIQISWGSAVQVETSHEGGFAINLPVTGEITSRIGSREFTATPNRATVFQPNTPVRLVDWGPRVRMIGVRVDENHLRKEAVRLFGSPLIMPSELVLSGGERNNWRDLAAKISQTEFTHPLVREQLAGAITTALLLAAVPDDDGPRLAACPQLVRSVAERLHAEPERAWTAADMAEVAGVSIRRLQEGFREHLDTSPLDYLRAIRLERVHDALELAGENTTVTEVAYANGIVHLGRFSAAYRKKYGETPSETLRRALNS